MVEFLWVDQVLRWCPIKAIPQSADEVTVIADELGIPEICDQCSFVIVDENIALKYVGFQRWQTTGKCHVLL
jgi:hypothetical protein